MPLTPEDVEGQTFKERFKGYDMDEVDAFLDRVVARLKELEAEREELRRRLDEAGSSSGESEQLLQRTLVSAQRTADQMVEEAQAEAQRIVAEAQAEQERIVGTARDEMAWERERLEAEAGQLARTIEDLKEFRARYLSSVRRVIEEQLARLERSADLPDVPEEVDELARSAAEQIASGPRGSEGGAPAGQPPGSGSSGPASSPGQGAADLAVGRSALDEPGPATGGEHGREQVPGGGGAGAGGRSGE